jgi:hypothetical protein
VTIQIARTEDDGLGVSAVRETATETGVYADMDEAAAWSDNSPRLLEDGGIVGYVSVDHDGHHTRKGRISEG